MTADLHDALWWYRRQATVFAEALVDAGLGHVVDAELALQDRVELLLATEMDALIVRQVSQ